MILTVGSTIVYPCQGPCLVGAIVERSAAGEPNSFYYLVALYDSGGELFVPVDNVKAIGIRLLAQRSDIPKLQSHLMETTKVAKDWRPRANDILKTVHLRIGV